MLIGPVIMELRYEEVEKSSLENSKIGVTKKITDFSKLNCPTSFPWKIVTFFGKEHVNWSIISEVTRGWSGKIKSWKINYLFGYYVNFHGFSRKWIFQNLIFLLYPIITQLIMGLQTCSLPKNVTTFHEKEDGIIQFCLRPHRRGVIAP